MSLWWYSKSGQNMLKGVIDDPTNPIVLPDEFILDFLSKIPKARFDFVTIFPTLLPEEQTRLQDIIDRNPFVKTKIIQEDSENSKLFEDRLNSGPIRTTGVLGGRRIG